MRIAVEFTTRTIEHRDIAVAGTLCRIIMAAKRRYKPAKRNSEARLC